jgi:hypothetical protein
MPLELGVWRIDNGGPRPVQACTMDLEGRLEDILAEDVSIASPDWMVIGRQVVTPWGKRLDLLAIDRDGNLVVLELKRGRTEREVVAQALDYGSWVRTLRADDIALIFNAYRKEWYPQEPTPSIDEAFRKRFGSAIPEELNEGHELVIVGSHFDPATERIVGYLADEGAININAVFFRVFKDGEREYLARAWLREPSESDNPIGPVKVGPVRPSVPNPKTDWNGEFYVSFGHHDRRDWEDARRYGFISAGGGLWYSNTLDYLEPGSRVWVNIPGGVGYVGVGEVTGKKTRVDQFKVPGPGGSMIPIIEADLRAKDMGEEMNNPEKAEYLVPVRWIKTVPIAEAVKEKGFFGNQNSVARPRDAKWAFTVQRLKERFGIEEKSSPPAGVPDAQPTAVAR